MAEEKIELHGQDRKLGLRGLGHINSLQVCFLIFNTSNAL